MRKQLFSALTATAVLAGAAFAWTDKGHRLVPELALKLLPAEVPVLRAYASAVIDAGPEPDRWRSAAPPLKDAQEPDHFLNFERAAFLPVLPPTRHKFIEAVYAEAARAGNGLRPEAIGYQPYIVAEIFDRLRLGFGEYTRLRYLGEPTREVEQRIAFYAGWLSHYVADGSQPLHATVHYDGWTGENPRGYVAERGIHSKFEGTFVEENINATDIDAVAPRLPVVEDLMAAYTVYLRGSLALVEPLYELEKAGAFTGAGSPEGRRFAIARLAQGRDMLAGIWLAAWQQSQWQGCLPFTEAAKRTSQVGCVTATIAATSVSPTPGGSAYLNFCDDYRTCALSVQIPGNARSRFPALEAMKGKAFQFYGLISQSGTRSVMYVSDPRQIRPRQTTTPAP